MASIASDDDGHSSATSPSSSSTTSDEHDTSPAEDFDPVPGTDANGRRSSVADVIDPVVAEEEESSSDYGLDVRKYSVFENEFE